MHTAAKAAVCQVLGKRYIQPKASIHASKNCSSVTHTIHKLPWNQEENALVQRIQPKSLCDTSAQTLQAEANMNSTPSRLIIHGLTESGRTFRPSDWAERLSGVMSTFGVDHRMSYSPYVKPLTYEGAKSVIVDKKLQEVDKRAFDFLLSFARDNGLKVLDDIDTDL
jgi:hypothetical protein